MLPTYSLWSNVILTIYKEIIEVIVNTNQRSIEIVHENTLKPKLVEE